FGGSGCRRARSSARSPVSWKHSPVPSSLLPTQSSSGGVSRSLKASSGWTSDHVARAATAGSPSAVKRLGSTDRLGGTKRSSSLLARRKTSDSPAELRDKPYAAASRLSSARSSASSSGAYTSTGPH